MSDNELPMTIFGLRNDVRFPVGATRVKDEEELATALRSLGTPHVLDLLRTNGNHLQNAPHGLLLCVTHAYDGVAGAQLRYERVSNGEDGDPAKGALSYGLALFSADKGPQPEARQFMVIAPVPEPGSLAMLWLKPPHVSVDMADESTMEEIGRFDVDPVAGAPLDVDALMGQAAASQLRH